MPTEEGKLNINEYAQIMEAKNCAEKANEKIDALTSRVNIESKPTNGELALMIKSLSDIVKVGFDSIHESQEGFNRRIEKGEKTTNDLMLWKVGFVAKFSAYSAVALIIGSILSQLLLKMLGKYI